MRKVVINTCFGGFNISDEGREWLIKNKGWENLSHGGLKPFSIDNEDLVEMVETLGTEKASGSCANLEVVEIPEGVDWDVDEYDGYESVVEVHRKWK